MIYYDIFQVMKKAAFEAGQYLNSQFLIRCDLVREYKPDSSRSVVTRADKKSEQIIVQNFREHIKTPFNIVTEESDHEDYFQNPDWPTLIVDPLDGTLSFVNGHTYYSVSIGLMHMGKLIGGVVYAPARGEFFYGLKNVGACMDYVNHPLFNGKTQTQIPLELAQISPEKRDILIQSNKNRDDHVFDRYLRAFSPFLMNVRKKSGSAAYNFIQVAAGRLHIQQATNLQFWDVAAALAIIEILGGKIHVAFDDGPIKFNNSLTHGDYHKQLNSILAGHPQLVDILLENSI